LFGPNFQNKFSAIFTEKISSSRKSEIRGHAKNSQKFGFPVKNLPNKNTQIQIHEGNSIRIKVAFVATTIRHDLRNWEICIKNNFRMLLFSFDSYLQNFLKMLEQNIGDFYFKKLVAFRF
jgi:hypothetical protein